MGSLQNVPWQGVCLEEDMRQIVAPRKMNGRRQIVLKL
jgi:hypothetical protein